MKRPAICFLAACMWISAGGYAQTITLSHRNVPLETIFKEIEKQTNNKYTVFYDPGRLLHAKPVSIDTTNISLLDLLEICFADQPFTYAITGTIITIVQKTTSQQYQPTADSAFISGKVINGDSLPLRANIEIQGTARGVTADADGYFKIESAGKNQTLIISHIGYEPRTIKTGNRGKLLYIVLAVKPKFLDEVIKKGYTNNTRRYNLGTVSKVTEDDIEKQPVNNLLSSLQGRVPGLILTQKGGMPGSSFNVQIRGQRSIGITPGILPDNSPLFIIDGVPFLSSSETLIQNSEVAAFNPFNTINPADVESIEILRDANATSIYGSAGANGVILISTKKPRPDKTTIDVNMYTGWEKITRAMDYMDTPHYLQMRREAFANDGETPGIPNAYDLLLWDSTRNINWKKLLIGGTGRLYNAYIRISGGSEKTQFTTSAGYNRQSAVLPGNNGKSLTSLSLQLLHTSSNNKLEIAIASSYGFDRTELPSNDPTHLINLAPNAPPPYDSLGHLNFRENSIPFPNPFILLHQPTIFIMQRLTTSIRFNYKLFSWLQAKTVMGYTSITADEKTVFRISTQDPELNPLGNVIIGDGKSTSWIIEPQLEFLKGLGRNAKVKALAGTSLREQTGTSRLIKASGYIDDALMGSTAHAQSVISSNDYKQYRLQSIYGLINFTWKTRYLLEATGRQDGSSRFGPEKQFANFASIAAGWIFSGETFIRRNIPVISYGKLRISYGTTGNDQIGDYQFLDTWISTQYPYQTPSFRPARLYNNDYSWEKHSSLDLGLDLGLFDDKILLTATWNQSRTGNQLIGYSLPTQTGFLNVLRNFPALVQNRNFEFEFNSTIISRKDFNWKTSFNISIQRNKLLQFPGLASSTYKSSYNIGQPLNLVWGYRTDGVDPATGNYRILDQYGKIIPIPNSFPSDNDLVPVGTYNPDYFGGLGNSFQYRNWQLDLLFQFVKQKGLNQIAAQSEYPGFLIYNQPLQLAERWQAPGNNASYQRYSQSMISDAYIAGFFHSMSDASITDASFIRLKNLSLSFHLPNKWTRQLKILSCSLYVQGQNILTFTSYKGNDPENGNINRSGLPPLKTFTFGIHASF